jgi:hypothetical protein
VVFARRDAAALATLEALLCPARDGLRVLWVHPDAADSAANAAAFERSAALNAVLPLSALCHEPPFPTAPTPLHDVFEHAAAAPRGCVSTADIGACSASAPLRLGRAALVALDPALATLQPRYHLACAGVLPLDAVPAALMHGAATAVVPLREAGVEAAAHALCERASAALVHSSGHDGAAEPAWALLFPVSPALMLLKWLAVPCATAPPRLAAAAGGARPLPCAVPPPAVRTAHAQALWAAALHGRSADAVGAASRVDGGSAEAELAVALRAADVGVRLPPSAAAAELASRLRARRDGAAAANAPAASPRRRAAPRAPAGGPAAPLGDGPSAALPSGGDGAFDAAVASAATAVQQYVGSATSEAVPVGDFAAEVVSRALRAARACGAGSPATWRQALSAALLLPPARLTQRHPAGCEPRAKRREYTLQALLTLWLSLEPRPAGDGGDETAPCAVEVTARVRTAATQAAALLAHCSLLFEPLGADGLARFCDAHVAPTLAVAAPATTRRLHAALGIGPPGAAHPRDRGGGSEAMTPTHALDEPPGRAEVARGRRPVPRLAHGGGAEPGAGRGRGGASLRLRRVAAVRPAPQLRPAPIAAAPDARERRLAAEVSPQPRARRAVALASPAAAGAAGATSSGAFAGGDGGGSGDDDDAVVPCTTLRRGARGAEMRSPRRSPRRARALALFAADSPPAKAPVPPRAGAGAGAGAALASPACVRCIGTCTCGPPDVSPSDGLPAPRSRRRSGSRAAPPPPPSGSTGRRRPRASDAADDASPRRASRVRLT